MNIWRSLTWMLGVSCDIAAETSAPTAEVPFACKLYQEISCRGTCVLPTLSGLQPCWWVQQSDHILFLFLVKPDTGFVTVKGIWMGHTCLSSRLKLMSLSDHRFLWNRIVFTFSIAQTTVIKSLSSCLATDYCKVLLKIEGCVKLRSVWNLFPGMLCGYITNPLS